MAGRRKVGAEQLCMDNISTGLNDRVERFVDIRFIEVSVNSEVSVASKFPNFYRTVLFSYLDFFPPYSYSYSFIIHPCVELSLLHSLMYFHSFFAVSAFSNGCMFLTWSMFTYLIELHLIPKMLSSQNNNADKKQPICDIHTLR